MSAREASLVRRIIARLRDRPRSFTLKIHGTPFGVVGIPDLLHLEGGIYLWLEVKRPGERPTRRQRFIHDRIRRAGGTVAVVHSWEDVEELIK